MNREEKTFDVVGATSANVVVSYTTPPTFQEPSTSTFVGGFELNGITQGLGEHQRVGSQINIIEIDCIYYLACGLTGVQDVVRSLLICDYQPNKAFPAVTDILQNNTSGFNLNSFSNVYNESRFQILRDTQVVMTPEEGCMKTMQFKICGDWISDYSGDGGLISNITTCAFYFLCFSVGGGTDIAHFNARVHYYDY